MKKILLLHLSLQPPGGANGVAAWMIEALKADYSLTVLTWTPVEIDSINRYYGTSLAGADFAIARIPRALRALIDRSPIALDYLKFSLLLRACKKIKDQYDVIISVNNEADLGRRGIQYIHFPRHYDPFFGSGARNSLLRASFRGYRRLCVRIAGFSFERMRQNLTLVNSDWTGKKVGELYGIATTTLHPPVAGDFPDVAWRDRENGFVCIGRMTPEKELDKIIDILAAVRSRGWEVHLHLIGSPDERAYYRRIHDRARQNSWIFLDTDLSRAELLRTISMHRYGIHGMAEEHFGTAVAEMVRGGCLVFVPRGGGQVEIVSEERLLYRTVEEAAAAIEGVLRDPDLQIRLRRNLEPQAGRYTVEQFARSLRTIVDGFAP